MIKWLSFESAQFIILSFHSSNTIFVIHIKNFYEKRDLNWTFIPIEISIEQKMLNIISIAQNGYEIKSVGYLRKLSSPLTTIAAIRLLSLAPYCFVWRRYKYRLYIMHDICYIYSIMDTHTSHCSVGDRTPQLRSVRAATRAKDTTSENNST